MNYFEFYDIIPKFEIDQSKLKRKFLLKSKEVHPDFHSLSDSSQQDKMLELSAINNLAYKTLSNKSLRFKHLLEILGVGFEEGKEQVPQDFLMEIMELNESLMELQFDPSEDKRSQARSRLKQQETAIEDELQMVLKHLENENLLEKSSELLIYLEKVKAYLLKARYLERLNNNLGEKA